MALKAGAASMARPYKVAFLITSMNRGGTESRLVDVLRCLDRSQFDPFLYVAKNQGELMSEIGDQQVYIGSSGNIVKSLAVLWRVLRRERPDVVWCLQSSALSFAGRLFAWVLRTPAVVLSIHGRYADRAIIDWPNRLVTRWTTDKVVILSKIYRTWLVREGVDDDLITVQYNGVDTLQFSPAADKRTYQQTLLSLDPVRPVIGTVGNLLPIKGHEILLKAARQVVERRPEALFVLVGDGTRRAELERLAQTLNLSEQVRFLGRRRDVPDLMQAFDVFVLTSNSEGCPNVILEAMATGLPVVSTSVGGVPELVTDETGILVPPGDDAALADAIRQLLDDPARRQAMGQAGRRRAVEHFSLETMIRARETLLLELLEHQSAKKPVQ
jgi:glycosyltransferase involved in cell wall biosynthesis